MDNLRVIRKSGQPIPSEDKEQFDRDVCDFLAVYGVKVGLVLSEDHQILFGFYVHDVPRLDQKQEDRLIELFDQRFNVPTVMVSQIRNANTTMNYRFLSRI